MTELDRRSFLTAAIGSLGLTATVTGDSFTAFAQAAAPARPRPLHIHHHFAPPAGVALLTSYGDTWLSNPAYRPVMEELNRRKAVVHVHPTAANCCRNLDYGVPPNSIEYGTDTTRAIIGVTFSGDAARFSDIRFIWSH